MNHYLNKQRNNIEIRSIKNRGTGRITSINDELETEKNNRLLLSIIVPVYNEEDVIQACHDRLSAVAKTLPMNVEILYVNDGSNDNTLSLLNTLGIHNNCISIIDLSRNYGKEIAMTAGFDHARGDAVIIIDADLQDPPELIPEMVTQWQHGYDVVYMKRNSRKGESWLKKVTAWGFYQLINRISSIEIPRDVGDFRLLSRHAVDSLCQLRESNRFMKGLFAWLGFKQREILYNRDERASGKSKWHYSALLNLAIEGITSFSVAPLKLASYTGLLCFVIFFLTSLWLGVQYFYYHTAPSSITLLATGLLLFAGLQMLLLGIIGEYLGRMYMETKKRPLYLINDSHNVDIEEQSINYQSNIIHGRKLS
ncbi:MAG TPA: glycosyltransferase [Gammaproteobacteria bacterium]|nr:glycosyltransferase [Gammaproteobacteria bacterium]